MDFNGSSSIRAKVHCRLVASARWRESRSMHEKRQRVCRVISQQVPEVLLDHWQTGTRQLRHRHGIETVQGNQVGDRRCGFGVSVDIGAGCNINIESALRLLQPTAVSAPCSLDWHDDISAVWCFE